MSRRKTRSSSSRNGGTKRAAKKQQKRGASHDDDDAEWMGAEPVLAEERDSVEAVDVDEDGDDEDEVVSKGKEEADGDYQEKPKGKTRSKRLRRRTSLGPFVPYDLEEEDDDDDEVLAAASEEGDYQEEKVLERPQADEPHIEMVTVEHAARVAEVNTGYLLALLKTAKYYRSLGQVKTEQRLRLVEQDIVDALLALRSFGMPLTQAEPIEHAVPPTVPEADGSELRFTHVAQSLGISWRDVPEEEKEKVYERAVELHRKEYGCAPKRVLMHTNRGKQPVYYYNEHTYRPTMLLALTEYLRRQLTEDVIDGKLPCQQQQTK